MPSHQKAVDIERPEPLQRCLDAANRYLSYRPRSEAELRERLRRRRFNDNITQAVISRLKEQGLVDDRGFAQFWKENRQAFRPQSQRLTRLELEQKGVSREITDEVAGTIDDDESAYQAATVKARKLDRADYQQFRRRLGDHLKRRGFSYDVISHTINRVWSDPE